MMIAKLFNRLVMLSLPLMPRSLVRTVAKQYIAGETLASAVAVTRTLNDHGMRVTIDVLGEEVVERSKALEAVSIYKDVLTAIDSEGLDANISVKPTQMGLEIDRDFCRDNLAGLADQAAGIGNFVRIDMEDSSTTDAIIGIYRDLHKTRANVGTVFQAYLRRLIDDVNQVLPEGPNLRLCKGIYKEPYDVAWQDGTIVNANYLNALEKLLKNGCYVGIATHDERLVHGALALIDRFGIPKEGYEFQMLLGVAPELRNLLVRQGHPLRVYVPFGRDWLAYSLRRLRENPDIAGYIVQGTVKRFFGKIRG